MRHYPVYLDLEGRRVVLAGGGEAALAKLRLLAKTRARIEAFAEAPRPEIEALLAEGGHALARRRLAEGDARGAALVYAAGEDGAEDARVARLARAEGAIVNIVDDLDGSDFITPAIVDRDPVTVAIGTEGAAPVLARAIKKDVEERLPARLGLLARAGKAFRPLAALLPAGRARRDFWTDFYLGEGPRADDPEAALRRLFARHAAREPAQGHVDFVGAGPGDPEQLTLAARKALDAADVVLHDRLAAPEILELARREATVVMTGKTGYGPSTGQEEINRLLVRHARAGARVARLKSGDPAVFGRLDEETAALDAAGIPWRILPGITAASAAAAALGRSLTRRGRNSSLRLLAARDVRGFAEHDWRALARPGEVAAFYMGRRAMRFIQGRLLMHGAAPGTPVSIVENASRPDQRVTAATLGALAGLPAPDAADGAAPPPALAILGLAPRAAAEAAETLAREIA